MDFEIHAVGDIDKLRRLGQDRVGGSGDPCLPVTQRAIDGPFVYFVTTNATFGQWLFTSPKIAQQIGWAIRGACALKHFRLFGYCILPNHIHLLVKNENMPLRGIRISRCGGERYTLSNLMHSIKRNVSRQQQTSGRLWQPRFNFRIVETNERLFNTIGYIKLNYKKMNLPKRYGKAPWVCINVQSIREYYEEYSPTPRGVSTAARLRPALTDQ